MNEEEEYPVIVFDYMGIDTNEDANIKDSIQLSGAVVISCIFAWAVDWVILAIVGLL